MSSSTQPFLNAQFDLYAAQTEAAELKSRRQSIDFRDVEDAIAFGLAIFANLRRRSELWAAEVAAGNAGFSWETSGGLSDRCQEWKQRTAALLDVADAYTAQGCAVSGEQTLRLAFKDVSLMALDADRARASFESLQAGDGIPHSEAMDELRRRMATRGA